MPEVRGNSMILADLNEMERFLKKANDIESRLKSDTRGFRKLYEGIDNWNDDIRVKTGEVVNEIERCNKQLYDRLNDLNMRFKQLHRELGTYSDRYHGKIGKL